MRLLQLVNALDSEFSFFKGADASKNGLQIRGSRDVSKVAVACDAALETIEKASVSGADFLLVHHGLKWHGQGPLKKDVLFQARLKAATRAGLSVYAQHLPLDVHPAMGNNVLLAQAVGLTQLKPACPYEGAKIAFKGTLPQAVSLNAFATAVKKGVGTPYRVLPFGSNAVRKVAVCSGSGGFCASNAKSEGFDTLLVGEFKHSDYHVAKEFGVNVVEAGHYVTETVGVQAVGKWLQEKFGVPFVFVDAPTGF